MHKSLDRVRTVINGGLPDRPPLYDLLRNDAVLNHFTGKTLTLENREEVVYGAYEPAIDATRPLVRLPEAERTIQLEDGREQRYFRWTIWNAGAALRRLGRLRGGQACRARCVRSGVEQRKTGGHGRYAGEDRR